MWFYRLAMWVTGIIYHIRNRLTYEGVENIPTTGGFIMACNHRSMSDPVIIAQKVKPPIHYMAKEELFRNKFVSFIIRHLNAFPVERGAGDTAAIQKAIDVINQGDVLGIFPEGTRSKDGKLLRPKSGLAFVAKMTHADILPVCIIFDGEPRFGCKVTVRYGKIIPYEALGFTEDGGTKEIREASKLVMEHIAALMEDKPCL